MEPRNKKEAEKDFATYRDDQLVQVLLPHLGWTDGRFAEDGGILMTLTRPVLGGLMTYKIYPSPEFVRPRPSGPSRGTNRPELLRQMEEISSLYPERSFLDKLLRRVSNVEDGQAAFKRFVNLQPMGTWR